MRPGVEGGMGRPTPMRWRSPPSAAPTQGRSGTPGRRWPAACGICGRPLGGGNGSGGALSKIHRFMRPATPFAGLPARSGGADPRPARPGPRRGARAPFHAGLKHLGAGPPQGGGDRLRPRIAALARKPRRGVYRRAAARRSGRSSWRPAPRPRTLHSWARMRPRRCSVSATTCGRRRGVPQETSASLPRRRPSRLHGRIWALLRGGARTRGALRRSVCLKRIA